jgi:FdhD protein
MPGISVKKRPIEKVSGQGTTRSLDALAVEEPLEIRIVFREHGQEKDESLSITMRTPGHDVELVLGFLYSEAIIRGADDVEGIGHAGRAGDSPEACNVVTVRLHPRVRFEPLRHSRHFYANASCGVCGKASLEALRLIGCAPLDLGFLKISSRVIRTMQERLRSKQLLFEETGGLHAAGLFDASGSLIAIREDIGRHNALDKVIGERFLAKALPLSRSVLFVSGRTSFEIMQKALMARIPIVAAVSAPSSLAVEMAAQFNVTLLGFVRGESFNIYAGGERFA